MQALHFYCAYWKFYNVCIRSLFTEMIHIMIIIFVVIDESTTNKRYLLNQYIILEISIFSICLLLRSKFSFEYLCFIKSAIVETYLLLLSFYKYLLIICLTQYGLFASCGWHYQQLIFCVVDLKKHESKVINIFCWQIFMSTPLMFH